MAFCSEQLATLQLEIWPPLENIRYRLETQRGPTFLCAHSANVLNGQDRTSNDEKTHLC